MLQGEAGCQGPAEVREEGECGFAEICSPDLQVPGQSGISFNLLILCRSRFRTSGQALKSGSDLGGFVLPRSRACPFVAEIRDSTQERTPEYSGHEKKLRKIEWESWFRARERGRLGNCDEVDIAPGRREGEGSVVEERLDPVGSGSQVRAGTETPLLIGGCQGDPPAL